jgi:hypothetical protein
MPKRPRPDEEEKSSKQNRTKEDLEPPFNLDKEKERISKILNNMTRDEMYRFLSPLDVAKLFLE